ncbi:MAG: oligoendopeptidase F, partial [Candidatus Dormibacteria bacterium]
GSAAARPLPAREDVPVEHTWATESIFGSVTEWEAGLEAVLAQLSDLAEFRGTLGDSPETLADWFDASERVQLQQLKVRLYAAMFYAVDATDEEAAARADRAGTAAGRLAATMAFAAPEMIEIGFPKLREWMDRTPRLSHLGHYFDRLEKQHDHVRSAEVEQVLNEVREPLSTALSSHSILANADLRFPAATGADGDHEVAQGTIDSLLSSGDRELRRSGWESYADAHLGLRHATAATLSGAIKRDVFFARARGYGSSLEAALAPGHIPTTVFHDVLRVFQENLGTWHRYWGIRRRALGVDNLRPYDVRARLSAEALHVPYAQAVEWISKGVEPLGEEYVEVLRRGALEDRWVDIYPNRGKRMGAFSTGGTGTRPFIFMSYNDDIYSMSTLAHELGHSMHSYYTRETQPYLYSNYGLFQAEVASNMTQALTRSYLLGSGAEPALELAVVEEAMANFYRYFFVMPSLARLELQLHERVESGGAITASYLNGLTADLLCEVFGDQVTVEGADRDRLGSTWAQFHTHLYANFYVYQYATGIAGANQLARAVVRGEGGAADRYLAFLKSGGSMYPLDGLSLAGVDMRSPEPVESAFQTLAQMVDRLEQLVGNNAEPAAPQLARSAVR